MILLPVPRAGALLFVGARLIVFAQRLDVGRIFNAPRTSS